MCTRDVNGAGFGRGCQYYPRLRILLSIPYLAPSPIKLSGDDNGDSPIGDRIPDYPIFFFNLKNLTFFSFPAASNNLHLAKKKKEEANLTNFFALYYGPALSYNIIQIYSKLDYLNQAYKNKTFNIKSFYTFW